MGTLATVDRAPSAGRTRLDAAVEHGHPPDSHTGVADRSVVSYQSVPAQIDQQSTVAAAAITSSAAAAAAAAASMVAAAAAVATPAASAAAVSQTADQIT